MCFLVIGADKLGNIDKNLYEMGVTEIVHIDGRKKSLCRKLTIPLKTDAIIVMTDFVNHNTSNLIKKQAKERSIPVLYSKRSWSCILCKIKSITTN
ncbi:hypothetical protein GGQ84_000383 [Desulfitispora alkaliphila]|uniref:DUF2325 domain-containing protein n=1 Tax=Desulfitispora alkaliphila TaxID=622674 RepID=UPI003D1B0139